MTLNSILSVLLAALSIFLLGGVWYSKRLFGEVWCREAGIPKKKQNGHGPAPFLYSFGFAVISAGAFGWILGPNPSLQDALRFGLVVGLGWVATSLGINYQFGGRSTKLFLIDGGYHVLQFLLYGLIFGLLHFNF